MHDYYDHIFKDIIAEQQQKKILTILAQLNPSNDVNISQIAKELATDLYET